MAKIRGSQIKNGTTPFEVVDSNFAPNLLAQKAIADFVQFDNYAVVNTGPDSITLDPTDLGGTIFADTPYTLTANVTGAPIATDLGFIGTEDGEAFVSKSKAIVRNATTGEPLFDDNEREIYAYFIVDTVNSEFRLDFYAFDGADDVATSLPVGVDTIDFQLMRRFTLNTVGEDFGTNEKWAMGVADVTATLNLLQLAQDLYGNAHGLDADGQAQLPTDILTQLNDIAAAVGLDANLDLTLNGTEIVGLTTVKAALEALDEAIAGLSVGSSTALQDHIDDSEGAHAASAIAFVSGTTGFNADNVQGALEAVSSSLGVLETNLEAYVDDHVNAVEDAHGATAIAFASGTTGIDATNVQEALEALASLANGGGDALAQHIAADWSDADAHDAAQIEVAAYVAAPGTFELTNGSLQDNLEDLLDKVYAANTLIETHLVEPSAHTADNIDVQISGTDLQSNPDLDLIGEVGTLQDVLEVINASIPADASTDLSNLYAILGVTSGESVLTLTGTLTSGTTDVTAAITALDDAIVAHINDVTAADIAFVSGTTTIDAVNVQAALEAVANRLNRIETEVVEDEVFSVTVAGANQVFTLAYEVKAGSKPMVLLNGLGERGFTVNGDEITITVDLEIGDEIVVWYKRIVTDIA